MKKLRVFALVTMMLCAVFALNAMAETPAITKEDVTMADWEGTWNSYLGYIDDEELQDTIKEVAEKNGVTVEKVKGAALDMMKSDFVCMIVKGDKVTFLDGFESRDGKPVEEVEYAYVQTHNLKFGNFDVQWHEFAAKGEAKNPVMLMMGVHGEEAMAHFHMRYGTSVEALLGEEVANWWPTFVRPGATYDQLKAGLGHLEIEDEADKKEEEAPQAINAPVELAEWDGVWNNMGAYLEDKELEDAFKTLAENEKLTVEEAKANYVKKRACEFNGMVIDGETITFLDNFKDREGKVIDESKYTYVETYKVKHGQYELEWNVFKAEKADAKYPVMLMMGVHGEEVLTHFHLRYGADVQELLKTEGWYPTFVKPASTYEQLAHEIAE